MPSIAAQQCQVPVRIVPPSYVLYNKDSLEGHCRFQAAQQSCCNLLLAGRQSTHNDTPLSRHDALDSTRYITLQEMWNL